MKSARALTAAILVSVFLVAGSGTVHIASADTSPASSDASSSTVAGSTSTTMAVSTTSTSLPPATNLDEIPNASAYWPRCASASVTYCFEDLTKLQADGSETSFKVTGSPYVNCHTNGQTSGPCLTDGSYWMEVGVSGGNFTADDLGTTFHWAIRTGKLSPDVMMLGNTQKTKVSGSTAFGWRLEIWAKPALRAYKDGCFSPQSCGDTTVAESVTYGMVGYLRMLGVATPGSAPKVDTPELRDALRGTFISTNGMSQSWDFKSDTFRVSAVSPHFLTDGNTVAPGYVKVFLPSAYVLGTKGYSTLSEVTSSNIALKVSSKDAVATVTVMEGGILVDTGVTHFSAPEPEVRLMSKSESSPTTTVATATTAVSSQPSLPVTTSTSTSSPTMKKGSSKTLSSIYRAKASQKAKWTASGACTVKGTKVVAKATAGTCTVTVRVLNSKKKYVVAAKKSYTVA